MISRLQAWVSFLTQDPLGFAIYALYLTVTVLLSLILHEVSHGYVAWRCGDPTAKMLGRLSLDPRKHLDPWGTICMFLLGFGWAKPVPVNPRNFRNGRRDDFLVSIAGITTNLTLFILCTALSVGVNRLMWRADFLTMVKDNCGSLSVLLDPNYNTNQYLVYNLGYAIANGLSLGDFASYMSTPWLQYVQRFLLMMGQINLSLAVFNLLPIPPLDGYHLVNDTLLRGRLQLNRQTFMIMQLVLMAVCLSGALSGILTTVNHTVYSAVLNTFLLMTGAA